VEKDKAKEKVATALASKKASQDSMEQLQQQLAIAQRVIKDTKHEAQRREVRMIKKFQRAHAATDEFAKAMVQEAQSDADATLQATVKKVKLQANRKMEAVKQAAKKKLKRTVQQLIKQQEGTAKQAPSLTVVATPNKTAVTPVVEPAPEPATKPVGKPAVGAKATPVKPEPASTVVSAVSQSNKKAVKKTPVTIAIKNASPHPTAKVAEPKQKMPGLRYMGCFSDRLDDRDLPIYHGQVATPEQCGASCEALSKGFRYAGIQNGDQCFCGASYGKHGNEPAATCFKQCSGADRELCGGVHRNSVYRLQ